MKSAFIILLTAFSANFSASAFAAPAVGDSSTYNVTITKDGVAKNVSDTQEITAIDQDTGVVTEKQTLAVGPTVISTQSMTTSLDQLNQYDMIVDNCDALSKAPPAGTTVASEQITVAAGTFMACHLTTATEEIYFAHVPNGILKLNGKADDGSLIAMELASFIKK